MTNDMKRTKKWYKLDNAATIYPSVRTRRWMAMFRLCAELNETVDPAILETALRHTLRRLPTFGVCVKKGLFWFYLEEVHGVPPIEQDVANPCLPIDSKKSNGFLFRVRYYDKRIALEFFHVLADGTGGLVFLKTLVGEYLSIKHGIIIPYGNGVLDCGQKMTDREAEDSFLRHAGRVCMSRSEEDAYCIPGEDELGGFMNIITGTADTKALLDAAHKYGVSLTHYITACMICSISDIQKKERSAAKRNRPVKICVPVNLRAMFDSDTVRNFASYVNPGTESRYGKYTLKETCNAVKCYMGLEASPQKMRAKFSGNVDAVRNPILKWTPLFIKIPVLRAVYRATGDVQTSALMSNLGVVKLPEIMDQYINRFDFQVGPLFQNRVMCAVISYKDKTYINFTRTLRSAETERGVFTRMVEDGVPITIESNLKERSLY